MNNLELLPKKEYYPVSQYAMRCRLYPNKTQAKAIDEIIHASQVFCNMVFYDVQHNFKYTTEKVDKKTGKTVHWLRISEAKKGEVLDYYRKLNPIIKKVPASALSNMKKSCLDEVANQYKPIGKDNRQHKQTVESTDHTYYSKKNKRTSFTVKSELGRITSSENKNTFFYTVPNVGKVKVRGWNQNIRFGENQEYNFIEYANENKKPGMYVTISKDNCNDYWVVFQFSSSTDKNGNATGFVTYVPKKELKPNTEIGIDCGIKQLAILSDGTTYENKKYKEKLKEQQTVYSKQLSDSWGWSNPKFRAAYKLDDSVKPSHNYEKNKLKKAKLSRKIATKRNDWQNVVTSDIVENHSFIGIESLDVKGMTDSERLYHKCGNRKLAAKYADALSDAAMSSFLTKLQYKCNWYKRDLVAIDKYFPSSKMCSNCNHIMEYMGEEIREWDCPVCGTHHDRDVNAAINILNESLNIYNINEAEKAESATTAA